MISPNHNSISHKSHNPLCTNLIGNNPKHFNLHVGRRTVMRLMFIGLLLRRMKSSTQV